MENKNYWFVTKGDSYWGSKLFAFVNLPNGYNVACNWNGQTEFPNWNVRNTIGNEPKDKLKKAAIEEAKSLLFWDKLCLKLEDIKGLNLDITNTCVFVQAEFNMYLHETTLNINRSNRNVGVRLPVDISEVLGIREILEEPIECNADNVTLAALRLFLNVEERFSQARIDKSNYIGKYERSLSVVHELSTMPKTFESMAGYIKLVEAIYKLPRSSTKDFLMDIVPYEARPKEEAQTSRCASCGSSNCKCRMGLCHR